MSVTPKALWYIESHLNCDLSLEAVAGAVAISRFHLCRAFASTSGQSLAYYVRARRLSEAAKRLLSGAPDILTLALEYGYGSHEAFTRAFRQHFGLTPEQSRDGRHSGKLHLQEPIRMEHTTAIDLSSRLEHGKPMLIFGLSQKYRYEATAGIPSQWSRFVPYLGQIPTQVDHVTYGVMENSDEPGSFRYTCGVEVSKFPPELAGFARITVPAQTYLVFEHREHISTIKATMTAIFEQGIPASGYKMADTPAFERYDEEFDPLTGNGGLEI